MDTKNSRQTISLKVLEDYVVSHHASDNESSLDYLVKYIERRKDLENAGWTHDRLKTIPLAGGIERMAVSNLLWWSGKMDGYRIDAGPCKSYCYLADHLLDCERLHVKTFVNTAVDPFEDELKSAKAYIFNNDCYKFLEEWPAIRDALTASGVITRYVDKKHGGEGHVLSRHWTRFIPILVSRSVPDTVKASAVRLYDRCTMSSLSIYDSLQVYGAKTPSAMADLFCFLGSSIDESTPEDTIGFIGSHLLETSQFRSLISTSMDQFKDKSALIEDMVAFERLFEARYGEGNGVLKEFFHSSYPRFRSANYGLKSLKFIRLMFAVGMSGAVKTMDRFVYLINNVPQEPTPVILNGIGLDVLKASPESPTPIWYQDEILENSVEKDPVKSIPEDVAVFKSIVESLKDKETDEDLVFIIDYSALIVRFMVEAIHGNMTRTAGYDYRPYPANYVDDLLTVMENVINKGSYLEDNLSAIGLADYKIRALKELLHTVKHKKPYFYDYSNEYMDVARLMEAILVDSGLKSMEDFKSMRLDGVTDADCAHDGLALSRFLEVYMEIAYAAFENHVLANCDRPVIENVNFFVDGMEYDFKTLLEQNKNRLFVPEWMVNGEPSIYYRFEDKMKILSWMDPMSVGHEARDLLLVPDGSTRLRFKPKKDVLKLLEAEEFIAYVATGDDRYRQIVDSKIRRIHAVCLTAAEGCSKSKSLWKRVSAFMEENNVKPAMDPSSLDADGESGPYTGVRLRFDGWFEELKSRLKA